MNYSLIVLLDELETESRVRVLLRGGLVWYLEEIYDQIQMNRIGVSPLLIFKRLHQDQNEHEYSRGYNPMVNNYLMFWKLHRLKTYFYSPKYNSNYRARHLTFDFFVITLAPTYVQLFSSQRCGYLFLQF